MWLPCDIPGRRASVYCDSILRGIAMKRLVGIALLASGIATSALAADLPARVYTKAPPPVVDVYNWTGFYIGGNIGYSWGRSSDYSTLTNGAGTVLFANSSAVNLDGVVGGGQVGYNWQVQNWVVGVEADIQGTDEKGSRDLHLSDRCSAARRRTRLPLWPSLQGAPILRPDNGSEDRMVWYGPRPRRSPGHASACSSTRTGGFAYGDVRHALSRSNRHRDGDRRSPPPTRVVSAGRSAPASKARLAATGQARLEYLYMDLGTYQRFVPDEHRSGAGGGFMVQQLTTRASPTTSCASA